MAKISARGARKIGELRTTPAEHDGYHTQTVFTLTSDGRVLDRTRMIYPPGSHYHNSSGTNRVYATIRKPENRSLAWLRSALERKGYTLLS